MYRIGKEEIRAMENVLCNGQTFSVLDVEREMKAYLRAEHFFLLTSGTGALISGLVALGIGPGDEVLVPAYTHIASALAVLAAGAIPVIVDVDDTLTMSPAAAEAAITSSTKAILPVHMQGMPADMTALCAIAKKHGIYVLENACQAVGGTFRGQKLGTWGDVGAFSYGRFSNISAGEGGGLAAKRRSIYERAYIYHDSSSVPYFGKDLDNMDEYLHAGSNFRVSDLTAAILGVQLGRLDGILRDRRKNRDLLCQQVKDAGLLPARSNDFAGECGSKLRFAFADAATAERFAELAKSVCHPELPLYSARHVCWDWEILFRHKGAFHPRLNPFFMESNQNLRMEYDRDMCPDSRRELARQVFIPIHSDWTPAERDAVAAVLTSAAKQL